MEVKINREIREYTESMYFGLSLRQFIFSVIAVGIAMVIYFALKDCLAIGTLSWMCVIGAAPFAAIGFFKYNGMACEELIGAWVKSEILMPRQLLFRPTNIYYEALKSMIDKKEKETLNHHDEDLAADHEAG